MDRQVRGRTATRRARRPRAPGGPSQTMTRSSGTSSSLWRPAGVTRIRSASRRTDRLPSPAAISPGHPSRRPDRIDRIGRARYLHRHIVRAARAPAARVAYHPGVPPDPDARAARREPRLQGPADEPGHLGDRRRGQLHRAAAARAGADRLGLRDGRRRGAPDAAGPLPRDGRRAPWPTAATASG